MAPAYFDKTSFFNKVFNKNHVYSSGIDYNKMVPGEDVDSNITQSLIVLYDDDVDYLLYKDKRISIYNQRMEIKLPDAVRIRNAREKKSSVLPKASNRREIIHIANDTVLKDTSFIANNRDWHDGGSYRLCIATTFAPVTVRPFPCCDS